MKLTIKSINRILFPFILLILVNGYAISQSFQQEQLRYPRVREAKAAADDYLRDLFAGKNLTYPPKQIFFRAFKSDQEFEVWVKENGKWFLLKEYTICALSGDPGPKRKQGDFQIPEGFYHISLFNPSSQFHLSMKVDYPNQSDRKFCDPVKPGGDIYIHGECVTIGCLPMTNGEINEIYWLSVLAKSNGQAKIPVHIFPFRMEGEIARSFMDIASHEPGLKEFWENLGTGYRYFQSQHQLPKITVDSNGRYSFH